MLLVQAYMLTLFVYISDNAVTKWINVFVFVDFFPLSLSLSFLENELVCHNFILSISFWMAHRFSSFAFFSTFLAYFRLCSAQFFRCCLLVYSTAALRASSLSFFIERKILCRIGRKVRTCSMCTTKAYQVPRNVYECFSIQFSSNNFI